jgi:hypothetical protein
MGTNAGLGGSMIGTGAAISAAAGARSNEVHSLSATYPQTRTYKIIHIANRLLRSNSQQLDPVVVYIRRQTRSISISAS